MEHDRELLAALEEHKKDMKSMREVVESLRKDLQELTARDCRSTWVAVLPDRPLRKSDLVGLLASKKSFQALSWYLSPAPSTFSAVARTSTPAGSKSK